MHLTLVIPELAWPEPDDGVLADLACLALADLLARGTLARRAAASVEATLCTLFGQPGNVSFAALRRAGERDTREAPDAAGFVCADPVHLRLHQDHLILADSDSFGVRRDEADLLVGALNDALGEQGRFEVGDATRWYLRLSDETLARELDAVPLSTVAGRSVERLLSESIAGRRLRQFLNEAQMLLHAHAANEARESDGQLPINGLWLWGGGAPPARVESDFDGVWTDDALARGLARCAGVPVHSQPADAPVFLEHAAPASAQLVVITDLLAPTHYENGGAYRDTIAALEQRWFSPLQTALAQGRVEALQLLAPTAYGVLEWKVRRRDRWKFWRRVRPLAALAQGLAANHER